MRYTKSRSTPPRGPFLSNPLLLGFDEIERVLDQASKASNDGYPPYNIEQINSETGPMLIRITLAVAGFTENNLDVSIEENQLIIKGKQSDDENRLYLHRGIAARQFIKAFVLADGMEVGEAKLNNGLLSVDLKKIQPERQIKKIKISLAE